MIRVLGLLFEGFVVKVDLGKEGPYLYEEKNAGGDLAACDNLANYRCKFSQLRYTAQKLQ